MNRTQKITFRVSPYERKLIQSKVAKSGVGLSEFCRYAALGKEVRHVEGLDKCAYELNKIGNNVNQLTVLCHQRAVQNPNLTEIQAQMHIHYIVNSVSPVDGRKWQSGPADLKRMRALSDSLCREHGLSVIEHGRHGHKSYGEYTTAVSWKQQLAQDIAACVAVSHSKADFRHRLDELGIDVDIGEKSILFTVPAGVYGLKAERKCSNFKLMSYGDFSTENIKDAWRCNAALADVGRSAMQTMQDVLLELGLLHCPEEPDHYQNMYFANLDFDGLTKREIEIALSHRALENLLTKARQANEKMEAERKQDGLLLSSVTDTLAEVLRWRQDRQNQYWDYQTEEENEYEL